MAARKTKREPVPKILTGTPSGVQIAYFTDPDPRGYKILKAEPGSDIPIYDSSDPWWEVPSVTTVLGVLDKPALSWWGMRVGIKGVFELWDKGLLSFTEDGRLAASVNAVWEYASPEDAGNIEKLLNANKLTVNHVRDNAGVRGQAAHDALEAWAVSGAVPDPREYPPEEFGYLVALVKFIDDMGGEFETGGVEIVVGSAEHGFAGRYDLRGRVLKDVLLVNRSLTKDGKSVLKSGPKKLIIRAGTKLLLDAKTSKGIYGSHLLQLEGYEGASVENGNGATDMRAVIHLSGLGEYQFFPVPETVGYPEWLAVLTTYNAMARVGDAL